jgi:F-type H+-transporting ATPase subunit delta
MSVLLTKARPFARAAFEFAGEHKEASAWLAILEKAAELVKNVTVKRYLKNPKVNSDDAMKFFSETLALKKEQLSFFEILVDSKKWVLLPEIVMLFAKYLSEATHVMDVMAISALEWQAADKKQVLDTLKTKFKKDVNVTYTVDHALIGGMILKTDTWVLDGSIKGKIKQLTEQLQV